MNIVLSIPNDTNSLVQKGTSLFKSLDLFYDFKKKYMLESYNNYTEKNNVLFINDSNKEAAYSALKNAKFNLLNEKNSAEIKSDAVRVVKVENRIKDIDGHLSFIGFVE